MLEFVGLHACRAPQELGCECARINADSPLVLGRPARKNAGRRKRAPYVLAASSSHACAVVSQGCRCESTHTAMIFSKCASVSAP